MASDAFTVSGQPSVCNGDEQISFSPQNAPPGTPVTVQVTSARASTKCWPGRSLHATVPGDEQRRPGNDLELAGRCHEQRHLLLPLLESTASTAARASSWSAGQLPPPQRPSPRRQPRHRQQRRRRRCQRRRRCGRTPPCRRPRPSPPTPTPVRTNTPVPTATPAPPTPTSAPPAVRWVAVGPPGPVPVGAGRVELGLVNRTGQPGQQTRVTAIVSAPGGQAYDTDTTVTGNQQANRCLSQCLPGRARSAARDL
ncbi:MAG: hypothetical protein KatS3mg061_2376 [Dehalococcoidia bacterium]|nr:MAG: hypothetical protein KatS3mg061_2376 [Dehalococcoidia bacterium]